MPWKRRRSPSRRMDRAKNRRICRKLLLTTPCRNRTMTMPTTCFHNKLAPRQRKSGALAFWGNPSVYVEADVGKAGAPDFFCLWAPGGARIAWLRCRAGVREGQTYETDNQVQIGLLGSTCPFGRVGLAVRATGASRRPENGRVCWLPGLQQPGHLASDRKNWALTPFVNSVLPESLRGGRRPTDTPTIRNMPRVEPQYGQA